MKSPFITSSSFGVQNGFASDAAYLAFTGRTPVDSEFYWNSTAGKYRYYFGGVWSDLTPSAGGNVNGPGSSTTNAIATWADASGTLLNDNLVQVSGTSVLTPDDTNNDAFPAPSISLLAGGKTTGTGDGGSTVIAAGNSFGGNGGSVSLSAGTATSSTFDGGNASVSAGSSFGGNGGMTSITAGNGVNGGNVSIRPGTASGGTNGIIKLFAWDATNGWSIDENANLLSIADGYGRIGIGHDSAFSGRPKSLSVSSYANVGSAEQNYTGSESYYDGYLNVGSSAGSGTDITVYMGSLSGSGAASAQLGWQVRTTPNAGDAFYYLELLVSGDADFQQNGDIAWNAAPGRTMFWRGNGDFQTAGNLIWSTDNTKDIGSKDSGTTLSRPRRAYIGSQIYLNTSTAISSGDLMNVANDSASSSANLVLTRFVATAGAAVIRMLKAAGTQAAKTAVTSSDALALIQGGGWDGSVWKNSFNIITNSTENWTTTAHGTVVQFNAVPTGVNNATLRFAMTGDGNLTVTPHLLWAADGASDIGLSTGQRPRDLFLRRNLNIAGSTSGSITISANATTTSYIIVMPSAQGSSGDTLVNDGSGNLSWAAGSGTSGTVNTTDATLTTLQTISTTTDTSMLVQTKIIARRTGGTSGSADDSAGYILTALIKNVAGTVTVNVLQTDYAAEDQVAWDATMNVSGTNVLVQVTGAANNNVTWKSITTTQVT